MDDAPDHLIAAVDLGSNSFRLSIGRVVADGDDAQIFPVDRLKETVRLAAGLTADGNLDEATIVRAVKVLERFGERLRGFPASRVRAVATNTCRVAHNAADFLPRLQAALGFDIDVISGAEEARLIYAGVSHSLPGRDKHDVRRLVVDIGGGSTEIIIGQGDRPLRVASCNMGCVTFSQRYFPGGAITFEAMARAQLAARRELEAIVHPYRRVGWRQAYGSSGTAKALYAILTEGGYARAITAEGLRQLQDRVVQAGRVVPQELPGIKLERADVLPGGLAIMRAVVDELGIAHMQTGDGALRVGVLYDLLGRSGVGADSGEHNRDQRRVSVQHFMRRYHVDARQAARVRACALAFFDALCPGHSLEQTELRQALGWAADLHEVGLSIAHDDYHQHSAYILAHADMPGFANDEQRLLALLTLAHQGKLAKVAPQVRDPQQWLAILSLRLAALLARRRQEVPASALTLTRQNQRITLKPHRPWFAKHPLTDYSLRNEAAQWGMVGVAVEVN